MTDTEFAELIDRFVAKHVVDADDPEAIAMMGVIVGESCLRGAAVAFGVMGMAEAIRRHHLGILNVVRVRTQAGPITFPPCDCEPDTVHTC